MASKLAQYNIARMRGAYDDPLMADFRAAIESIHRLAERSPGFVRLIPDEGYSPWGDPNIIPNLTVWDSVDALRAFTYRTAHGNVFSKRDKWFEPLGRPHFVMWWIADNGIGPDYDEATRRLDHLRDHGPSPEGFTFGHPFDIDGQLLAVPTANRTQTHAD